MAEGAKKILFSVDSKWRDLPSYVLLKGILEKQYGHKVYLVPMGSERYYIPFLKPEMVIFNHLMEKKKSDLAKQLKKINIAIGILPTEGAPISRKAQEVIAGIYHDYKSVDLYFTWNRPMMEIMLEYNVLPDNKLKVTGVPRFDFYRPPANKVLVPKQRLLEKYGLHIKSPVVTLATNFVSARFARSNADYLSKDAENLRITDIANINERIEWCEKEFSTREQVLSIFEKLAESLPDVNFLLKHHPMEDIKFYRDYGVTLKNKGMKNVAIISKEHIWDILNATDILIQRSCTTAAEAWMLNIPTIQLQLSDYYYSPDHLHGNEVVHSYNEAIGKITEYLKGKEIPVTILDNRKKALGKMYFKVDGKSSERCAMYLNEFLISNKFKPEITATVSDVFRLIVYSTKILIRNTLYSLPPIFSAFHNKLGNVDKRVRRRDIRSWERKLNDVVNQYIDLNEKKTCKKYAD